MQYCELCEVLSRFSSHFAVITRRGKLLAFMNLVFFTCVFAAATASEFLLFPLPYLIESPHIFAGSFPVLLLSIFLFNLAVSAFAVVTLPGFAFFPLSTFFLLYRASFWGLLLSQQPTWNLLVAMPTLVFEGEGYALACLAGTVVGVSWIRPRWICAELGISRAGALVKALKECVVIYFSVVVFLFVAAVIEAATLTMIPM